MNIEIKVEAHFSYIVTTIPDELKKQLLDDLKFRVDGYKFTYSYTQFNWDGYKSLFDLRSASFSTGLLKRVCKLLKEYGHNPIVEITNAFEPKGDNVIYSVQLYDFQKDAVEKALKNKYCIIDAPVRSGKTAIIASLISRLDNYPIIVVTYQSDLVLQTKLELEKLLRIKIGTFYKGEIILKSNGNKF